MSVLPVPEAPGPNPGQPGHYAHHDWLTAGVKALDEAAALAFPPGLIAPYAGPAAPAGYLLCEGQVVGRGQYANLFDAIGTAYGMGDGTTTFGIPDLRQRVPMGKHVGVGHADTLGEAGGEVNHTLTDNEVPYHNHGGHTGGADANHSHGVNLNTQDGGSHTHPNDVSASVGNSNNYVVNGAGFSKTMTAMGAGTSLHKHAVVGGTDWMSADHAHAFATDHRGAGWAHNNLQPYLVLNYIIKT